MESVRDLVVRAAHCIKQGDAAQAELLCAQALQQSPEDASVLHQLAMAAHLRSNIGQAIGYLRRAVISAPASVMLRNNLAVLLENSGQYQAALEHYEAAARLAPSEPTIHFNRGNTLRALHRLSEAIPCYRKTLEIDRNHTGALHNLAVCLSELGHLKEAESLFRNALALDPTNLDAHVNLGSLLQKTGRPTEALDYFRKASALRPDSPEAAAGEAAILDQMGDVSAALDRLTPFLATASDHPDVLTAFATLAPNLQREQDAINALQRRLEHPLPAGKRRAALFALGHLFDRLGRYDDAFRAFREGHESAPATFDAEHFQKMIDDIISVFSEDFMRSAPRAKNDSQLPIFVVGMPRSGTTLVEQILASHPRAFGAGELPEIERLAFTPPPGGPSNYPQNLHAHSERSLTDFADRYLANVSQLQSGAIRVIDKMPGNFMHVGFISLLFPKARVIHIQRDPLDTCLSCYFQNFNQGHEFADTLPNLGFVYRNYLRLMDHWRAVAPIAKFELRYENLVMDQEAETRRLLEFCELEWDDRCLRFHESRRMVQTASYAQVRQPLYKRSVSRHRNYLPHLSDLQATLSAPAPE